MMNDPKRPRAPTIFAEFQKARCAYLPRQKTNCGSLLSKGLAYDGTAIAFIRES